MQHRSENQTMCQSDRRNRHQILTQSLVARADDRIRFDSYTVAEKDRALEGILAAMERLEVPPSGVVIRPRVARLWARERSVA